METVCEFQIFEGVSCGKPATHFIHLELAPGVSVFGADDPLAFCDEHFRIAIERSGVRPKLCHYNPQQGEA